MPVDAAIVLLSGESPAGIRAKIADLATAQARNHREQRFRDAKF
jgi:hypothetical protein